MYRIQRWFRHLAMVAVLALHSACTADPTTQLERVAKDWSLTIRASQVIPVYPLTEDVRPGDVFLVPTSISEQTAIYEDKGFLPTDQLVTRLTPPDYERFYQGAFLDNGGEDPAIRPLRTAFPSYSFSVDRSEGLKLALPIQGIPFGLGLMGASSAAGTVSISESYTYGVDGESVYRDLIGWYGSSPAIRHTLAAMARSTEADIFLRIVTRVHLAGELDVALSATKSTSGGLDAGAAQEIGLQNLSSTNAADVRAAGDAYQELLKTLSNSVNEGLPGGSIRFAHVDRRAISMRQTFERPLVIGFVGFDVKVLPGGSLSAPIPSFSVLSGETQSDAFGPITFVDDDGLSDAFLDWLDEDDLNYNKIVDFLAGKGIEHDPADLLYNRTLRSVLKSAQSEFSF